MGQLSAKGRRDERVREDLAVSRFMSGCGFRWRVSIVGDHALEISVRSSVVSEIGVWWIISREVSWVQVNIGRMVSIVQVWEDDGETFSNTHVRRRLWRLG